MNDHQSDLPMTEAEWEALFRKSDLKAAKFQELLETFHDQPGSDAIIAREMGWTRLAEALEEDAAAGIDGPAGDAVGTFDEEVDDSDSYVDVEGDDLDESWLDDDFDDDDDEAVEEWKQRREQLTQIPAYRAALLLGKCVSEALRPFMDAEDMNEDLGHLIGEAYISAHEAGAKIAGGHAMGYDDDVLCGNIVNNRIALAALQRCQQAWSELEQQQIVLREVAKSILAEAREVAKLVEERIAELRSRVWW